MGLKKAERRKRKAATTIVLHVFYEKPSTSSRLYPGDIAREALKQPLLNDNESRHVGYC